MIWWHKWRANVWAMRYYESKGRLYMMDKLGSWNQWERQMEEAKESISSGLCAYHRLKAGIPV